MQTSVQNCQSKVRSSIPSWFHRRGHKMRCMRFDRVKRELVISGSAATVTIRTASILQPSSEGWLVDWEVVLHKPSEQGVRGRVWFHDQDLGVAFGLSEISSKVDDDLKRRYKADAVQEGRYIRQGNYLNIPCPGIGCDGDPNVSVFIDEKMQVAVRQLLAAVSTAT